MAKEKKLEKKVDKKSQKKKEVKKAPKEKFMTGVKKELKLVKWPNAKDILKYTIATILFCIILVIFFELLNFGMAYVKGLFN